LLFKHYMTVHMFCLAYVDIRRELSIHIVDCNRVIVITI